MKKFFVLTLVYGIGVGVFAQIETVQNISIGTSDKWVISANNLKTSTGRLLMAASPGSLWTIYIYTMADNKYVTSFAESNSKGLLVLPPGEYRITLNNAPVENVLIRKGHDTRLKTGVLNVMHNDVWYLYDERRKNSYTSGNKPEKILLPVGTYILEVGETRQPVVVKEIGYENIETELRDPENFEKWEIIPGPDAENASSAGSNGSLDLNFPGDTTWEIKILGKESSVITLKADNFQNGKIKNSLPPYSLAPGKYNIWLNYLLLDSVPIISGKKTRIRTGLLKVNSKNQHSAEEATWRLFKNGTYSSEEFSWSCCLLTKDKGPARLPIGKYDIKIEGATPVQQIIITDKATTPLNVEMGVCTVTSYDLQWRLKTNENHILAENNDKTGVIEKTISLPVGTYKLSRPGEEYDDIIDIAGTPVKEILVDSYGIVTWTNIPFEHERWIMTPQVVDKPSFGSLELKFPPNVDWSCSVKGSIYDPPVTLYENNSRKLAQNKSLISNKDLKMGKYIVYLFNVPIHGVWIREDYKTRLKAGILSITSAGQWTLYHSSQHLGSGNSPKKIVLPVGEYKLNLNGNVYEFNISDGITKIY